MNDYVYKKRFDSLFCELVPAIMANVLNHIIVVLNVDSTTTCADRNSKIEVYTFFPENYNQEKSVCTLCGIKLGILVIRRCRNHFDACVQAVNYSSPCSCNISTNIASCKTGVDSVSADPLPMVRETNSITLADDVIQSNLS